MSGFGLASAPQPQAGDSPRLRVLMISDVYFPRVNGVSTSIATFRDACAALDVQVDLVAPQYDHVAAHETDVVRVRSRAVPFDPEDRLMARGALRKTLDRLPLHYDLIHVQTPFLAHYAGVRLARRTNVPVVATYHTFFEEYLHHYVPATPRSLMRALARSFSRRQCRQLDAVVVPSSMMLQSLRGYGVHTPAEVIPTGIDLAALSNGNGARFRLRNGIEPRRPVMLYVGRVAHEKNLGFLLDVVAQTRRMVPEILFVIAGEGPAQHALQRRARQLGLEAHVKFVGYLSRQQDLQDCYCAGDAFVFASRTETQGLVLLEAMACGTPVVSTAHMGTKDVLEGTRGALVVEESALPFAQAIALVLRDRHLRNRLGQVARGDAQRWTAQAMARRMTDFYRTLVASRSPARRLP